MGSFTPISPDDIEPASGGVAPPTGAFSPISSDEIESAGASGQASTPQTPQPVGHAVEGPSGGAVTDALSFLRTAATKAVAGFAGLPRVIEDANNKAQFKHDSPVFPSTGDVEDAAFNHTAPEYQPASTAGQYGMTGATFAAPAVLTPETAVPNAARQFIAGLASEGAQRSGFPAWTGPLGTALTEFLARRGAMAVTPHTVEGEKQFAGKVLNETAPAIGNATPALPGMQLSVGQMTGDPNLLTLDRQMTAASPEQAQIATNARTTNQAVVRDTLGKIAGGPGGVDASLAQSDAIKAAEATADKAQQDAWAKVGKASFATGGLKDDIRAYMDRMKANGDDDLLPSAQIGRLLDLQGETPLASVQARRSRISADARDAARNGQSNNARVVGGVAKIIGDHLDNPDNLVAGTKADIANYNAARSATRDYYDRFGNGYDQNPLAAKIVSGQTDASRALAKSLPAGPGGPEGLARLKMAVGTKEGLDPARDYVVSQLKTAVDQGPKAFGKVLDDFGYAFKDNHMFTPAQQSTINDARDAIEQTYRTAAPGAELSSPTYKGLTGGNFARTLYGNIVGTVAPTVAKLAGAGTASFAATALGAPPGASEIIGPMMGKEAAEHGANTFMSGARDSILGVLNEARRNPPLARELQMKATAANLKMAPTLRNMMRALGFSEAEALPRASSE